MIEVFLEDLKNAAHLVAFLLIAGIFLTCFTFFLLRSVVNVCVYLMSNYPEFTFSIIGYIGKFFKFMGYFLETLVEYMDIMTVAALLILFFSICIEYIQQKFF